MKRLKCFLGILILMLCFTGTSCSTGTAKADFVLYYISTDDKVSLVTVDYKRPEDNGNLYSQVDELLKVLQNAVSGTKSCVPPMGGVDLNGFSVENGTVILDFGKDYLDLGKYEEISVRAAIVKTLTQLKDVDTVFFSVNGDILTYSLNNSTGGMKAESFADISANSLRNTKEAKLVLYFASEDGAELVREERSLYYRSAMSPERVVIEQLIAGPNESFSRKVIANGTKLLDISVKEGTCYVNFDATFSKGAPLVAPEVTIYAIVNSLAELSNISKVQISIEADSNVKYMETISLNQAYGRNLDLLKKAK